MERSREMKLAGLMEAVDGADTCCEALKTLALRFHDFLNAPSAVAMMRIMIAESLRDPVFARQFYCRGRDEVTAEVAALFQRWAYSGRAAIDDAGEAAALFMATTLSDTQINAMVPAEGRPCREAEHARLIWRVEHFCKGFGIR
ncbi:TetR/AcrR family transcriptional regulator C-terminal domain-containing protein [Sphingomonas jejuensis]